ncbi:VOC family protein [Lentzea sp. PSKA42]|uniref:VOC family protein n=1 Tax=Lentzea indica TaxID=2604800 RepID=A0ABX1FWL6_9PSEU|nr:VOC family protein [Lentzea indica]NKE63229.1 VOC family protein [Lentzea indica]
MARLHDIVFDCAHPASLARFWAEVLDDHEIAPYDEAELSRLRSMGIDDPEDDPSVLLDGSPRFFFNRVPEPKTVKNRVHVDLRSPNPEAEAKRLFDLGATLVSREGDWFVLTDPEGNEFCLSAE